MKKLKWVVATLLLAAVPMLAWVSMAKAQHFANNVDENQTIYSSVYSTGKEVTIKGTIYGDVFCAGQKVTVSATVYGDVICAGIDVTISGKVDGDVRAAGQIVTLGGEVGKNATVASLNFSLDAHAKVGQDLTAKGDQINIKGAVGRDVVAAGATVTLNGSVGRNVKASGTTLQLKDSASIAGNLHYTSGQDAKIDQKAEVKGKTQHEVPQRKSGFNVMLYLFILVSLTLIGLVLTFFFPRFMRKTTDQIVENPPKTMLVGLAGVLLAVVLPIGLLISLAGIPLALMVLLAGLVGAVLSGPITAYWIGRLVFRKKQNANPALIALVGGPILITIYHLPVIGLLAMLLALFLGFGSLLLTLKPYVGLPATASAKKK